MYKRIVYIVLTVCFFNSCTTYSKFEKVNVGMTKTEVLNLMGNPDDKENDNYGDEAWQYSSHNLLQSWNFYTVIMFYNDKVTEISFDNRPIPISWEKSPGFIKAKRTEDEAKAKELGYPSVEAYNEAVKRQSFGNLATLMSLGMGIPFKKGDVIIVPAGVLVGISMENENGKIVYLVGMASDAGSGKAIYILSSRELKTYGNSIVEKLKLKCRQPAKYKKGLHIDNTWLFERIE